MTDADDPISRADDGQAKEEAPRRGRVAARHLDLDQVAAYLGGDLATADQRATTDHLAACAPCRREVAELRATLGLLGSLPQYAPRRSFRLGPEHARGSAGPAWVVRFLPALPALRVASGAVAAMLLLASVGGFVADRGGGPGDPPSQFAARGTSDVESAVDPALMVPTAPTLVGDRPTPPALGEAPSGLGADPAGPIVDAANPVAASRGEEASKSGVPGAAPREAESAADSGLADPPQAAPPESRVGEPAIIGGAVADTADAEADRDAAAPPATESVSDPGPLLPGAAPDPDYSTQVAGGASTSPTPSTIATQVSASTVAPGDGTLAHPPPGGPSPPIISGWQRTQFGLALLLIPLLAALAVAEWVRLRNR